MAGKDEKSISLEDFSTFSHITVLKRRICQNFQEKFNLKGNFALGFALIDHLLTLPLELLY